MLDVLEFKGQVLCLPSLQVPNGVRYLRVEVLDLSIPQVGQPPRLPDERIPYLMMRDNSSPPG